jgi:hypothetical protein
MLHPLAVLLAAAAPDLGSAGAPGIRTIRGEPCRHEDVPRDLRGKIAVLLQGAPRSDRMDFFPPAASAVYADGERKLRVLAARGAVEGDVFGRMFASPPESPQDSGVR